MSRESKLVSKTQGLKRKMDVLVKTDEPVDKKVKEAQQDQKSEDVLKKSIEIPLKISLFDLEQITRSFGPGMKGLDVFSHENKLEIRIPGLLPPPFLGVYVEQKKAKEEKEEAETITREKLKSVFELGALLQISLELRLQKYTNCFYNATKHISVQPTSNDYKQVILLDLKAVENKEFSAFRLSLHFDHLFGHCVHEVNVCKIGKIGWLVE